MDNPFTWKEPIDEEAVKDLAWWEEQKAVEKKSGFIVDPDEGIVADPENEEMCKSCNGTGQIIRHGENGYRETDSCPECVEKLSDPNDCPRCRGVKRKVPPLCDSCSEEVEESDSEAVEYYVRNRAKLGMPYTIYKMSFMAKCRCKTCGAKVGDDDLGICGPCHRKALTKKLDVNSESYIVCATCNEKLAHTNWCNKCHVYRNQPYEQMHVAIDMAKGEDRTVVAFSSVDNEGKFIVNHEVVHATDDGAVADSGTLTINNQGVMTGIADTDLACADAVNIQYSDGGDKDVDVLVDALKAIDEYEAKVKKLEKNEEIVKALIAKWSKIDFREDFACNEYGIILRFSAGMMGGHHREEQRYIAEEMGKRVEYEIATSKFIEKARENTKREKQSLINASREAFKRTFDVTFDNVNKEER